jgi:hypothetical protein
MTGHQKFSKLTQNFSEDRQAKIKQKTAQIQAEIDQIELQQALQLSQSSNAPADSQTH